MYLHLSSTKSIRTERIVGVFDMDTATVGQPTRAFLARAQRDGRVIEALDAGDIPRSFVVTDAGEVILTQTSAAQIRYRVKNPVRRR